MQQWSFRNEEALQEILHDAEKAALHAQAWPFQVPDIEIAAVVETEAHRVPHGKAVASPAEPVHQVGKWPDADAGPVQLSQVPVQGHVVVVGTVVTTDALRMVGEDRGRESRHRDQSGGSPQIAEFLRHSESR